MLGREPVADVVLAALCGRVRAARRSAECRRDPIGSSAAGAWTDESAFGNDCALWLTSSAVGPPSAATPFCCA
eukprot:655431-Prymnesium_polylepis.1